MTHPEDHRTTPRYPVNIQLRLRLPGTDGWVSGILLSVGTHGAFVKTGLAAAIGGIVDIELPLRQDHAIVRAKVRWSAAQEPVGLGIQFADLPKVVEDQLVEAVISGAWLTDAPAPHKSGETRLIIRDLKLLIDEI